MKLPLRILHLEDNPKDAELIRAVLSEDGITCEVMRVETRAEFLSTLESGGFDLIFADNSLPSFDGLSALGLARQQCPDVPFILISGTLGEELAIETLKSGATDYVLKQRLSRLVPAVRRAMNEVEERSARKKAEEQLRVSEGLRLIGQMAASIIHDFRSPMQIILGASEIITFPDIPNEKKTKQSEIIREQVRRMANMTQDLLDFTKGEARLEKCTINVQDLLSELSFMAEEYCRNSPVRFKSVMKNSFTFVADRDKLLRVLVNLVRNAKEAMPAGGEIIVTVHAGGLEAVFEVRDTGPGIPAQIRDRLFQPFATFGKAGGTGLGLALSRKIIQDHNGTIDVQSEPAKGTTFTIRLPLGKKNAVASPVNESTSKVVV